MASLIRAHPRARERERELLCLHSMSFAIATYFTVSINSLFGVCFLHVQTSSRRDSTSSSTRRSIDPFGGATPRDSSGAEQRQRSTSTTSSTSNRSQGAGSRRPHHEGGRNRSGAQRFPTDRFPLPHRRERRPSQSSQSSDHSASGSRSNRPLPSSSPRRSQLPPLRRSMSNHRDREERERGRPNGANEDRVPSGRSGRSATVGRSRGKEPQWQHTPVGGLGVRSYGFFQESNLLVLISCLDIMSEFSIVIFCSKVASYGYT